MARVSSGLKGEQFRRTLPRPKPEESTTGRIVYDKEWDEIQTVQNYLFGEEEVRPSKVGEECFDQILKEAQR